MVNNDSKGICVSISVWFAKPEKTDRPVFESCRKVAIKHSPGQFMEGWDIPALVLSGMKVVTYMVQLNLSE